ncbi:MAG: peroxiredoxin [Gammaproteobacteria bacterium]|nr:peroxiredoxin [Gammaproteobacteria bacterium]
MQRLFIGFVLMFIAGGLQAEQPAVGEPAPDFRLQDQNGDWHSIGDYSGQWVVMYFYPKDDTPGCTTEACAFRDDIFKFRKMKANLLGVSVDDVKSHAEFAEKYHLPFPLLSDVDKDAAEKYGVLGMMGLYTKRETFIIAPDGSIAQHYRKVDPDKHSAQVLADLAVLMETDS